MHMRASADVGASVGVSAGVSERATLDPHQDLDQDASLGQEKGWDWEIEQVTVRATVRSRGPCFPTTASVFSSP